MICPKSYQYRYEMGLDATTTASVTAELGIDFHQEMAQYANAVRGGEKKIKLAGGDMLPVAKAYIEHHRGKFPKRHEILLVEEPFFVPLIRGTVLRCTFDLVYRTEDDWIYILDYKTFDRAPSQDVELNFQARLFIAQAMNYFRTDRVAYIQENVRRTPPGAKWKPEECYIRIPIYISEAQAAQMWTECQDVASDLMRRRREGRWYRSGAARAGFNSPCPFCFQRDLCKTELALGTLDEQTISQLSKPLAPLTLPPGWRKTQKQKVKVIA
jgi:PD-(D/E)XK nuclease superfamily